MPDRVNPFDLSGSCMKNTCWYVRSGANFKGGMWVFSAISSRPGRSPHLFSETGPHVICKSKIGNRPGINNPWPTLISIAISSIWTGDVARNNVFKSRRYDKHKKQQLSAQCIVGLQTSTSFSAAGYRVAANVSFIVVYWRV